MSQKHELGKGLKALLGNLNKDEFQTSSEQAAVETIFMGSVDLIPLAQIFPNPFQPRHTFEAESLDELAQSIKTFGLIQPLTLRKKSDNQFEIISGERRFRASQLVGLTAVPAYIRTADDQEILEMALIENIQREDLNPIEIGISYQRLIEECNLTQDALSDRVGKKRSTISNYTRLLKLPPEVQNALKSKTISMGHARVLAGVDDLIKQIQLYKDIVQNELSVRQTEQILQKWNKPTGRKVITPKNDPVAEIKTIENRLSEKLGTKVVMQRNEKGEGQIQIKFKSDRELNDILDRLEE
ncbi:MAG: ParB/RepB/Spo0J family partition protein [Bacteroidota bacterium]|nr:ParB/RepB/Spo0J family partition protein [Bacteroidota bacterium]